VGSTLSYAWVSEEEEEVGKMSFLNSLPKLRESEKE
jgi:hypothetical protein